MKRIFLHSDIKNYRKYAIVDDADYPKLVKYRWNLNRRRGDREHDSLYAQTRINKKSVGMHRLILRPKKGMVCDHIDHNGLNNRRSNLRLCTIAQNSCNRRPVGTSQYLGVSFDRGRWRAQYTHRGRTYKIGTFVNELEAARAYNEAARKVHGKFANLNKV